jgi:hypothetical protein
MQSMLGISSFLIYTARGEILTVSKAFVSVSLLNIMLIPLIILPIMVGLTLGAAVAAGRVNTFLISDEINKGIFLFLFVFDLPTCLVVHLV